MELTREQLETKLTLLETTLGVIAHNERSCPDIFKAREMAARSLEMADTFASRPPPKDVFEAYGLTDEDEVIVPGGTTTVAAIREDIAG